MASKPKAPPDPSMTLGNMTSAEDYRQLAAQEAALAKTAVTNENRAQHYAMAAYYTQLADAKEKLASGEILTRDASTDGADEPLMTKQPHGPPMTLGNMREHDVQRLLVVIATKSAHSKKESGSRMRRTGEPHLSVMTPCELSEA